MAMTTTRFTNNVTRAKAVAKSAPKFGGSKPSKSNLGQSAKSGKGGMGGASGNSYGGSKPALLNIKGA